MKYIVEYAVNCSSVKWNSSRNFKALHSDFESHCQYEVSECLFQVLHDTSYTKLTFERFQRISLPSSVHLIFPCSVCLSTWLEFQSFFSVTSPDPENLKVRLSTYKTHSHISCALMHCLLFINLFSAHRVFSEECLSMSEQFAGKRYFVINFIFFVRFLITTLRSVLACQCQRWPVDWFRDMWNVKKTHMVWRLRGDYAPFVLVEGGWC